MRLPQLLDSLVQGGMDEVDKSPERLREELAQRLVRTQDPEERLALLRRFKNEETLRIGLADIGGELSVPRVAAQLTSVADAILDECLFLARSEQRLRHGEALHRGLTAGLVVVALGKLGGNELGLPLGSRICSSSTRATARRRPPAGRRARSRCTSTSPAWSSGCSRSSSCR